MVVCGGYLGSAALSAVCFRAVRDSAVCLQARAILAVLGSHGRRSLLCAVGAPRGRGFEAAIAQRVRRVQQTRSCTNLRGHARARCRLENPEWCKRWLAACKY